MKWKNAGWGWGWGWPGAGEAIFTEGPRAQQQAGPELGALRPGLDLVCLTPVEPCYLGVTWRHMRQWPGVRRGHVRSRSLGSLGRLLGGGDTRLKDRVTWSQLDEAGGNGE